MSVDKEKLSKFTSEDYSKSELEHTRDRMISELGQSMTLVVCAEELSELIKVSTKGIRFNDNRDNALEELADVIICINAIKQLYNIQTSELNQMLAYKLDKINRKLDEGEMAINEIP